ncbi:MAG: TonB-dependent receptor [Bacteroidota bacterium]
MDKLYGFLPLKRAYTSNIINTETKLTLNRILCALGLTVCVLFSFGSLSAQAQKLGDIRGFVYNDKTGEPVIFTTVFLQGTSYGGLTDVNGFFSFGKIPAGNYKLTVIGIGFDTLSESVTLVPGANLTRKLTVKERSTQLQAVEIQGTRSRAARENTVNASLTQVTPREIKMMPSIGGEPDIAQYLQTIPGIVSTGDQGGQIYIRGGTPVQNLVLLDGMVVYNPFHSIGLFSVFDTEIIRNADIYTGGFGAEYGGRASAVMDVRTIDGNKNRISGKVGANTFTGRLLLDGPIWKSKTDEGTGAGFVFSARSSFLDKSSKVFYPYAKGISGNGLPFSFTDLYGKTTLHAAGGSKASLFGFSFNDKARLGELNNFNWNSWGIGSNFLVLLDGTSALISGNFSYSSYDIGISETASLPRSSTIDGFNGQLDFTYNFDKDELKYGLGVVSNNSIFQGVTPTKIIASYGPKYNSEVFTFARYKWVTGNFIFEPGIRMQYYSALSVARIEPRLGIKYKATDRLRFKTAMGRYSQNLFSTASDRDVVNLFSGYITSPDAVYKSPKEKASSNLQTSYHLITGVEFDLNDEIEFSVEPYLKYFDRFVNINREKKFQDDPDFIQETSLAKGIDFQVKYEGQNLFLQLSYSLSKITRTYNDTVYAPIFDRRHNMNVLAGYHFGKDKKWEFDLRYNLGSGFPFTQTVAFYENQSLPGGADADYTHENGNLGIYYGNTAQFNRGRLPYYHRLDLSLKRNFELSKNAKLEVSAGVTNAYNRDNVFYVNRVTLDIVRQLPIMPSLGATLAF